MNVRPVLRHSLSTVSRPPLRLPWSLLSEESSILETELEHRCRSIALLPLIELLEPIREGTLADFTKCLRLLAPIAVAALQADTNLNSVFHQQVPEHASEAA